MALPVAVFIDTSIFEGQNFNFGSTALTSFVPAAKRVGMRLLLPDPTEREIARHIARRAKDAVTSLEQARKHAPFLTKLKDSRTPQASEIIHAGMNQWREFLGSVEHQKLGYEAVNLQRVMTWYDRATPPFGEGKKRKEFPDAFCMEILDVYARQNSIVVAIVSHDGDFKAACELYSHFLHFKSLPELTELLLLDANKLDELGSAIRAEVSLLEDAIWDAAKEFEFRHYRKDYEIRSSKIHNMEITDVHIVAFSASECTLTFEMEIEAEHSLRWVEWSREDEAFERHDYVIEQYRTSGTAKATLDSTAHNISSVIFIELDELKLEVSKSPRDHWY